MLGLVIANENLIGLLCLVGIIAIILYFVRR